MAFWFLYACRFLGAFHLNSLHTPLSPDRQAHRLHFAGSLAQHSTLSSLLHHDAAIDYS